MPSGITDSRTSAVVTISGDHHYIHMGKGYGINGDTASIAADAHWYISFKTPVNKDEGTEIHFRPTKFSSITNSLTLTITESSSMSSGTKAIPRNRNRYKKDNSKVEVYTGATQGTAGAISLYSESVGSGGAQNKQGGSGGHDEEIILKSDTMYDFDFHNSGSVTATIGTYFLTWYEE